MNITHVPMSMMVILLLALDKVLLLSCFLDRTSFTTIAVLENIIILMGR